VVSSSVVSVGGGVVGGIVLVSGGVDSIGGADSAGGGVDDSIESSVLQAASDNVPATVSARRLLRMMAFMDLMSFRWQYPLNRAWRLLRFG
jgi:hypothetical protein